ncbi:hypothetical protein WMF30_02695 [Sorangium sp. So ce134]
MGEISRLIVWNMNGFSAKCDDKTSERRVKLFECMLDEHQPSLFALQESVDGFSALLSASTRSRYRINVNASNGLVSGYLKSEWDNAGRAYRHQVVRATMILLRHISVPDVYVRFWNVHLRTNDPSTEEQQGHVKMLCSALEEQRAKCRAKRPNSTEILAGDFNMDPFDQLIVGRGHINANRSPDFVNSERPQRPYEDKGGRLFNATWHLLGRTRAPLGTYYKTGYVGGPWYVYDQVFLSPEHCIRHRPQARLIVKVNKTTLYSSRSPIRRPDENIGSDHFPLRVRFQLGNP